MKDAEIELLVLDVKAGNPQAFTRLYQEFYPPMRKYAVLRVGSAMVADDLTQNVWLKVSKRVLSLRDVALFRSWLYKALRWEILDWQRRSSKEVLTDQTPPELEVCAVLETPPYDSVLPALKQLSPNERDVAELFYLNDLSIWEIHLIVGVPLGTVKSRLHRARQQLKSLLQISNGDLRHA